MKIKSQNNCAGQNEGWLNCLPLLLLLILALAGCATQNTVQARIHERADAFAAFSPEVKELVQQSRVQVGMNTNAVYIAWGKPAEILESGDQSGAYTTWIYRGGFLDETRYWVGWRQPHLVHDYEPRSYVRSEIVFFNGRVQSWRTLPQPTN
jgi:hypothetical protein